MPDLDGPITLAEACAATGLTAETIRFATAEEPFNGPMTLRKVFGGTTVLRLLSMLLPEQAVALGMAAADGVQLGSNRLLALEWDGSIPRGTWIGGLHEITVAGPAMILPADQLAADLATRLDAHRAATLRPN